MRIPAREEFSPLPEVIDRYGLPDPLEVLPLLENELEAVEAANARLQQVAAGLRSAADDLETEASAVDWFGEAADRFRAKNTEIAQSFRAAAVNIDSAAAQCGEGSEGIKGIIREIAKAIMVVAGIVAGIIGIIVAGSLLATIGAIAVLVGALATAVYFYLDEIWWLGQKIWDGITWIIEQLTSSPSGHPMPNPTPLPPPIPPSLGEP